MYVCISLSLYLHVPEVEPARADAPKVERPEVDPPEIEPPRAEKPKPKELGEARGGKEEEKAPGLPL